MKNRREMEPNPALTVINTVSNVIKCFPSKYLHSRNRKGRCTDEREKIQKWILNQRPWNGVQFSVVLNAVRRFEFQKRRMKF
jgi:hypothetical protein